jgi:hypothetical protein
VPTPKPPPPPQKAIETPLENKSDGFDHFKSTNSDVHRGIDVTLEAAFGQAGSPSGIDNLVRLIDAARAQLALENRVLRDRAQLVIERLVAAGFVAAQLAIAHRELRELRKKMAALRQRLKHLQRRLKTTFATAGKTGDAQFTKQLGAQLDRLRKLEPGMARAMLALQTIEQAYGTFADGATPVLRLPVGEAGGTEALGRSLTHVAPGVAIARATLALLREGPSARVASVTGGGDDARLEGPRAFVHALLPASDADG